MRSCKIREFANLIGTLVAACPDVNYGWVYLKTLEREKILALIYNQNDYDQKMEISEQVRTDLNWWKRNIQQSVSNIRSPNFDWTIYTDASMTGWGAVLGSKKIHGFWNKTEREQHINFLELKAIQLALKNFEIELENSNVLLKVDNTTAISYINKMGGVKYQKFNHLAKEIWKWDETRDIWLFAVHIPSEKNVIADRLSRIKNIDTKWEIAEFAFEKIVNVLGYPDIDLFASERNKKCTRYCTWENNPNAWVIDSFTISWKKWFFYAFPPFSMILRTLNKIIQDKAMGIMVVPEWKSQPWYPMFKSMLIGKPLRFEPSQNLLLSPYRSRRHPMAQKITLLAGIVSGDRI
ncbi:PREDICTED: uncharacterized protein LOC108765778 [Trachymyrmex cornetzi]|nr:PREDICTED: uncharacterized protein LOC108765778 [Trachymyrmex cornetzi]